MDRTETQRADRERRARLALVDAVTKIMDGEYDTVEGFKEPIDQVLGRTPDDPMMSDEREESAQLAERRSAQAAELIRRVLADLHLSPEQEVRAAEIVPQLQLSLMAIAKVIEPNGWRTT